MSGFEIAGIALGAFPLLLEASSKARVVFAGTKMWWRFETEFDDFISSVEKEYIAFSQIVEILLAPLDISDRDQESLQNDPNSTLWHKPEIQAELRLRIQNRYYQWFMSQLNEIINALTELYELLPVGKVYLVDSDNVESTMFRVKSSFSQKKDRLMTKVRSGNEKLYGFLDRASRVAQITSKSRARPSARSRSFLALQEQSKSVLNCLQRSWVCRCGLEHPCGAAVLNGDGGGGGQANTEYLNVLFTHGTEHTQLRVEVCGSENSRYTVSEASNTRQDDIALLKQQMLLKRNLKDARNKGTRGIFSLALSAISLTLPGVSRSNNPGLEKPQAKLTKVPFLRRLVSDEGSKSPTVTLASSESDTSESESEEAEVAPKARGVRFAESSPSMLSASTQETKDEKSLKDMCLAASGQLNDFFLGFLKMDRDRRALFYLNPQDQKELKHWKAESLEVFLSATPQRDVRLRLGLSIILTVLNLGGSSWIPTVWSKEELFLLRDSNSPVPLPYLSHASMKALMSNKPSTPSEMAGKTKKSLLSLGILLMELIFRETLELQPFRDDYLGKTGQPIDITDFCTALRWQQRVQEDFGDGLADAIRRCILCAFDPTPDLGSLPFVQAVFQNVVGPVEQFLAAWNRSPIETR